MSNPDRNFQLELDIQSGLSPERMAERKRQLVEIYKSRWGDPLTLAEYATMVEYEGGNNESVA